MTTSNTTGAITNASANLAAQQAAPKKPSPANMMRKLLDSEAMQKLITETCKEKAGEFTASVIELYSSDKSLQKYDPKEVFTECMKAATLNLPLNKNLGFSWVIPFNDIPTFTIGYKGFVQLAQRTGAYKYINAGVVYEGEFKGMDKLSGAIDISGEKLSEEVVGYFAYIETINGFSKPAYWTKEDVIKFARKYSAGFRANSKSWREEFDKMAIKTVLKDLISKWGVMSVEMVKAMDDDRADNADAVIRGEQEPAPASVYEGQAEDADYPPLDGEVSA